LIAQTGFDGTAEEIYFKIAQDAVARGYNCLVFEGPGQGEVIRAQGIPFRHNWETVITPVVSYAINLKEVDKDRIALMGISMGGYLVPRALAYEHRVKLGIANGGIFDFHEACMEGAPPGTELKLDNQKTAAEIDAFIRNGMKTNPSLRWVIHQGMYTFQARSPSEWLKMTRPYTLKGIAQNITCKMLIVNSENDISMKGQAKRLYDALHTQKDLMIFTTEEGAGEHCQVGAYSLSNEQIFNWLDNNL
jgi:pimeloyl-ACP methyl ester carboxylesterase